MTGPRTIGAADGDIEGRRGGGRTAYGSMTGPRTIGAGDGDVEGRRGGRIAYGSVKGLLVVVGLGRRVGVTVRGGTELLLQIARTPREPGPDGPSPLLPIH